MNLPSRNRRRAMADINVVPYIDVMLVLLVVFMVAAPLLTQGVKLDLPKETSQPIQTPEQPMIVSVKADGSYWFKQDAKAAQPISWESLQPIITAAIQAKPTKQVLVEGDQKVVYGEVIHLMSLLQQAGVEHVGLVTEPPEHQ